MVSEYRTEMSLLSKDLPGKRYRFAGLDLIIEARSLSQQSTGTKSCCYPV